MTWQPIETAPKDGSVFLAWAPGYKWPETVRWFDYDKGDAADTGQPGYWTFADPLLQEVTDDAGADQWTHWMPIPALPAQEQA